MSPACSAQASARVSAVSVAPPSVGVGASAAGVRWLGRGGEASQRPAIRRGGTVAQPLHAFASAHARFCAGPSETTSRPARLPSLSVSGAQEGGRGGRDPFSARQPLQPARSRNRLALTAARLGRVTGAWRAARGRVRAPSGGVGLARLQGLEAGSSWRLPWRAADHAAAASRAHNRLDQPGARTQTLLGCKATLELSDCAALRARWSLHGCSPGPALRSALAA